MAEASIGPKLEIQGQAEFKRALGEIDRAFRVNMAEIAKVTAEYDKNDQSAQALTARNEVLEKAVTQSTKKIDTLRDALKSSTEQFGESDKRTLDWQEKLYKAEGQLAKLTRELDENKESLGRQERGFVSVGDAVRGMTDIMGVQAPPAVEQLASKLDNVSASGAALIGVLGGTVAALAKMTTETAKTAKEIETVSQMMGMSTDEYQEWDYVMRQFGGSAEEMQGDLSALAERAMDAAEGSGEAAEMFRKLRVRVSENGQLKDQNRLFDETVAALQNMSNETERNAIASALLSTTGERLVPVLNAGKDGLASMRSEAHELGIVMSEDTIGRFAELNEAMTQFEAVGDGLKNSMAQALLPILTELFKAISAIPVPVLQTIVVIGGIVTTVVLAVKAIKELTGTAGAIKSFFSKDIDLAAIKTTAIILGVVAAVTALVAIIAVLSGKAGEVERTMNSISNTTSTMQNQVGASARNIPRYARGTSFHPGGRALVGEEGPEIIDIPRGSKVYPTGTAPTGNVTQNITVLVQADDLKQASDVVRLFEGFQRAKNAGRV